MTTPEVTHEAAIERARTAAIDPEHQFGNFFLSRFLDLGISYDDAEKTCGVMLPYAPYLCNPQGSVHGGIIATAMDISMGHLCHRFLSTSVTLEIQYRYLRPLKGNGHCEGKIISAGRRIIHLESRMTDENGRLAAFAVGSWHRLDAL
jgi:uncharacterized protein (TIGR00369 family)